MSKKKVLIFIDWYLPGFRAGGPIRSVANLVANLRDEFEFFVVTGDTDYATTVPYKGIKTGEWNILPDGTRVYYFSREKLNKENIRKLIDQTAFDAVYLNGIYSRFFTLVPLRYLKEKKDKKVIIAARGMLSKGSLGVKPLKKRLFLLAAKLTGIFDGVLFHATNPAEEQDIRAVFGNAKIKVAGNLPQKITAGRSALHEKKAGELRLLSVARIAPEKNLLYALQILSQVKGKVAFDVYGPVYNKQYWEECQQVIRSLPSDIIVSYKGSVESEKVDALFSSCHMLFMPSTGENFGHIILQSLSAGCPVIISDRTPWKGLAGKKTGNDLPLEEPDGFVRIIEDYIALGQKEFNEMSAAAIAYAKTYSADPGLLKENIALFV